MANQDDAAKLAAQRAAANMNFLANSYPNSKTMNAQNGTTFAQGSQLTYTSPILPGWARYMRVFYNLAVTIAMGAGAASLNAGAPYNMFSNVGVDFSGQNHRSHSGYWLKVLQQSYRGLLDLDASKTFANTLISTSLPIADGANTWKGYMDIPLQIEPTDVAGLVPIGESATPLTLRLTCSPAFVGSDPFTNVINLTGGATLTSVTGTITAVVSYRYGQSVHSPQIRPETPYIGSFAKIVESTTIIGQNQNYVITELRQPYPHLKVMQAIVVPQSNLKFCDSTQIGGVKFKLDPSTDMNNFGADGGTYAGKLVEQRELYHGDLDEGVHIWDFIAGSMPEVPNGMNTPNIGAYNASQTECLYNGALVGTNDRIMTAAMFLETLPY